MPESKKNTMPNQCQRASTDLNDTDPPQDSDNLVPEPSDPLDSDDREAIAKLRHDFRTPINHIIGYSELLLEEAENSTLGLFSRDLCKIHAAGKTLLGMLDTLISAKPTPAESGSNGNTAVHNAPLELESNPLTGGSVEVLSHSGHLLVVDDNETNRDMLVRRLQHQGYQVDAVEDGLAALDYVERSSVDLVLLDVLMPELDGYETLRRLKADGRFRDIPVIMISALDELQSVVRCIERGAEDYLPKPFNPVLLRARIGACLEKKRLRDQEVLYLRDVSQVTNAASAVEDGRFAAEMLSEVSRREDELGQLARIFQKMAREVLAREERFKKQIETLRVKIDETKKDRQVAELTKTDFFQKLQAQARNRLRQKKPQD